MPKLNAHQTKMLTSYSATRPPTTTSPTYTINTLMKWPGGWEDLWQGLQNPLQQVQLTFFSLRHVWLSPEYPFYVIEQTAKLRILFKTINWAKYDLFTHYHEITRGQMRTDRFFFTGAVGGLAVGGLLGPGLLTGALLGGAAGCVGAGLTNQVVLQEA